MNGPNGAPGTLYLVPNTLGKTPENNTIPEYVLNVVRRLDVWIVENIQTAVRYLQWVGDTVPDYEIQFLVLNKKTPSHEKTSFLKPLKAGKDAGLLSEAGCPGVADPGSEFVTMAHRSEIRVVPLAGPSSILLALMASGCNGQRFAFHGYLPIDREMRRRSIQQLEQDSARENRTQIFMEAPHRNDQLVKDVIDVCRNSTRFSMGVNLTLPDEKIHSKPISEWKKSTPDSIHKEPAIFLIYAGN